ncbi:transposase [Streptomyces rubiginosohelvolus]|uniref:transposase n=1 Tax=Streptomyces rubiginosohelvolus TaxID=67362 RepID=UPI0036D9C971
MSEPFARADQRRRGGARLRGLLPDGGRTPVEPVAARPGEDDNRQASAHLVTSGPWDAAHVRARPARRVQPAVSPRRRSPVTPRSSGTGTQRRAWPGRTPSPRAG